MKMITHSNSRASDDTRRLEAYLVYKVNNFPPIDNKTRIGSSVDWAIWIMECQNARINDLEEQLKQLRLASEC